MATFVGTAHRVYIGQLDLSGLAREINFGDLTREMKDNTTFNDGGFTCVLPGLISGDGMVKGNQDFAAGVLDDTIGFSQLGSQYPISVIPSSTTAAVADPCWLSRGLISKVNPLDGAKGDTGSFDYAFGYDTVITQGKLAHPSAARTADGTGTAVAQAGPTASQKLYAALHVTAYSGFTNVVFKVQSDDNSGFSSATDRITFTTVAGLTSEFASVAGSFSSETHLRAFWDVTGSGSVTFTMTFGVL